MRWWFGLGRARWTIEWAWGLRASWFLQRDDEDWTLGIGLLFAMLYVSVYWRPIMGSGQAREIGLRFHDGAMCLSATTPQPRGY